MGALRTFIFSTEDGARYRIPEQYADELVHEAEHVTMLITEASACGAQAPASDAVAQARPAQSLLEVHLDLEARPRTRPAC